MFNLNFVNFIELTCYDPDPDPDPNPDPNPDPDPSEKLFTQEQVNTFLAAEKRKTQEADRKLMDQLQDYKKKTKLTEEEKADWAKQIEDLQTKYMTAEERQRQMEEKQAKKHQKELEELNGERDNWKQRFVSSTIEVALTNAATKKDQEANNPEHIAALLRPVTRISDILDEDGKPTGRYEPRVKFRDTDKGNKPIDLDLTVNDAVKRMSEMPEHSNLFKNSKTGGLGGTGSQGVKGKIDIAKIAREDPKRYRELRKERPELFV